MSLHGDAPGTSAEIRRDRKIQNAMLDLEKPIIDRAAAHENATRLLDDHRIALEAFQNKKKPRFVGR